MQRCFLPDHHYDARNTMAVPNSTTPPMDQSLNQDDVKTPNWKPCYLNCYSLACQTSLSWHIIFFHLNQKQAWMFPQSQPLPTSRISSKPSQAEQFLLGTSRFQVDFRTTPQPRGPTTLPSNAQKHPLDSHLGWEGATRSSGGWK